MHVMQLYHGFTDSLRRLKHTMATDSSDESSVFRQLDDYPWESDGEFQSGLIAILGSNPSPEQAEYLTLRAKCFYYARYLVFEIIFLIQVTDMMSGVESIMLQSVLMAIKLGVLNKNS